jgi:hypothetical protein
MRNKGQRLFATSERAGSILISDMGDFRWIVKIQQKIVFSTVQHLFPLECVFNTLCGLILSVYGTRDHIWRATWEILHS